MEGGGEGGGGKGGGGGRVSSLGCFEFRVFGVLNFKGLGFGG